MDLLSQLGKAGWVKTTANDDKSKNLSGFVGSIASRLGTPVRNRVGAAVEVLSPCAAESANPFSLSGKHGFAPFPLHCDTSHWPVPCRFVILACLDPGSVATPTLLLDLAQVSLSSGERLLARSAVFLIRNGRRSFYASILSDRREYIRLDPGCMEAVTEDGKQALDLFSHHHQSHQVRRVEWRSGDLLIIDNWRVLHGRGEHTNAAGDRKLLRVIVQ